MLLFGAIQEKMSYLCGWVIPITEKGKVVKMRITYLLTIMCIDIYDSRHGGMDKSRV